MQQDRLTPERAVSISDLTAGGNGTSGRGGQVRRPSWGRSQGLLSGAAPERGAPPARRSQPPEPQPHRSQPPEPQPCSAPAPGAPAPPLLPPPPLPTASGPAGSLTATDGGARPSRARQRGRSVSPERGPGTAGDRTEVTLSRVRRAVRCLGCGAVPPCCTAPFRSVPLRSVPCCAQRGAERARASQPTSAVT